MKTITLPKMFRLLAPLALLCALPTTSSLLAQATPPPPAPAANDLPDAPSTTAHMAQAPLPSGPTVLFDTTMGRLTCKLYTREAPVTTANFIGLAEGTKEWVDDATQKRQKSRFYDGTTFHRVIPEFMIQGGDRLGTGAGDPGYYFQDEIDPSLTFDVPGRLAMANAGAGPTGGGTNGSQFFITEVPVPQLNGKHTIFGQCDDASVARVIAIARVDRDGSDKPTTPVVVKRVTIVGEGDPIPPEPPMPAAPAAMPPPVPR